ncbi:B3 domain-containing protein Os11g0197600-like isoform X2 [Tripterygium wilfordii]|uniref:B3 domain-containing protein Os11g0197600-like isoform X2 n=1 Tax=Tripterygium wilfordii TaxID=458696 RepID=UPI0018F82A2E|nr:B3 domain-containing protein Os11g0197600-like isoform X2 [Tripterygium wilfordii]
MMIGLLMNLRKLFCKVKTGMSSGWRRSEAGVVKGKETLKSNEKVKAFQRASAFQSENPYFMVVMQPSYVNPGGRLKIPVEFGRDHLPGKRRNDVRLCVPDGRTWSVEYLCSPPPPKSKRAFGDGWKEFMQENSLKIGDVCVFELINSSRITFKVFIFKVLEYPNIHLSLDHGCTLKMLEPEESLETTILPDFTGNHESGISELSDLETSNEAQTQL